jgi:hypothetical protein
MRRVKAFGVEFELGEEQGRRTKVALEEVFEDYRRDVKREFERRVERHDVPRLLQALVEDAIKPFVEPEEPYRCTIYVPDIVFKNVLYRLTDYYPAGGGAGSIYASRYGIIGRSWRLGVNLQEDVPGDPIVLIEQWGMTLEEAASQEPKSFATFLLQASEGKPPVGLVYAETGKCGFERKLEPYLRTAASHYPLTRAVERVMEEMRGSGPMLDLFEN